MSVQFTKKITDTLNPQIKKAKKEQSVENKKPATLCSLKKFT
jgi:hypothetical protein